MPWIKRKQDEHVCQKPSLDETPKPFPGDIWECDDPACVLQWKVHEHQIDGLYWLPFPWQRGDPIDRD